MTMNQRKFFEFEEGRDFIQNGFTKLKRIIEGLPEPEFSPGEYLELYTTIYNMCNQKPPYDYSPKLYQMYKELLEEYISLSVLPSLREKHDEFMLRELVKRWANHKVMVRCLSRIFHYLDRYFIVRRSLPALNNVGFTCFCDEVYEELKGKVRAAVITLVDQEREGGQIDRALMKNVLVLFVEIRSGRIVDYEKDFEEDDLLKDSASCYAWKALNWIFEDSCPNYLLKAEQCLEKGSDEQCLEKKRDGTSPVKVEDLSTMYRLCHNIPKRLEKLASIFKQHYVTALVQQVEDAADNKAESAVGSLEPGCVRKVIELYDKYMTYVNDCFDNHSLFQKALEDAFAEFCNKNLGCSSAELLASFSDDIPKKGGTKELGDEEIEDTWEFISLDGLGS